MGFGIKELLIVLVVIILLFGTKKLKNLGADLGSAVKGFKKSIADEGDDVLDPVIPAVDKTASSSKR